MNPNTLVVLYGTSLLGACMGVVGTFAVLRGRSLTGDALAHAALPGICLAFLLVGERNTPAMLAGSLVTGLLGVATIVALRRWTRIKEDAAVGIVLSVFFGAGVVLSSFVQRQPGLRGKAGLESFVYGSTAGMLRSDVYWIAGTAAVCFTVILLLYKEFKVVAFDSDFADVQGWPAAWLDLLLMGMVAVTVVVGLPAVGVVMVAALLILPAVTARLWTDRFGVLLLLAGLIGLLTGIGGTFASTKFDLAGPIVILTGTAILLVSLVVAPRGIVRRWLRERRDREAVLAGEWTDPERGTAP